MGHMMVPVDELLEAIAGIKLCDACGAGLGIHVEGVDWDPGQLHSVPCPATAPRRTLRLVDTDSHIRCRHCGKKLSHDIGGGIFGEVEGEELCVDCGPQPSTWDTP